MQLLIIYSLALGAKSGSISIIEKHAYKYLMAKSNHFNKVKSLHISKIRNSKINFKQYRGIYIGIGENMIRLIARDAEFRKRIRSFKSFHIWFDDIDKWKLTLGPYKQHKNLLIKTITSVLCPRKLVTKQLNTIKKGFGAYVPWSIPYGLFKPGLKTKKLSMLVDYNKNLPLYNCRMSYYNPLIKGIRKCKSLGIDITVYTCYEKIVESLKPIKAHKIPHLPYNKYIELQNKTWIHASGVDSSYEFSVMESQILGNYIFSLCDKVNVDIYEKDVTGFVINNEDVFVEKIKYVLENMNPRKIHSYAKEHLFNREEIIKKIKTAIV